MPEAGQEVVNVWAADELVARVPTEKGLLALFALPNASTTVVEAPADPAPILQVLKVNVTFTPGVTVTVFPNIDPPETLISGLVPHEVFLITKSGRAGIGVGVGGIGVGTTAE